MRDDGFRVPDWKDGDGPSGKKEPEETYYTYYDEPREKEEVSSDPSQEPFGGPLRSVEAQTQGEFVLPAPSAPYEYYDDPEPETAAADLSGFTKAGFGARLSAWVLDGIISSIPGLLAAGILLLNGADLSQPVFFHLTLPRLLILALRVIYRVATTALFGGTLGKLMLKLKVISTETGKEPTFWQCLFRETFGKYLSGAFLGIGYLMVFSEKGTLHDRLADTAVVYDL